MVSALFLAAAVAAAATPSVSSSDLVEAADISGLAASPDGHLVAFRTSTPSIGANRIAMTWYVVPVDGSAPARPVGDGGAPDLNYGVVNDQTPVWAPSSRGFYYRAAVDGETQIWRASVDGAAPERMTADPSDVRSIAIAKGGAGIDYEVGATRDAIERAERDADDKGVLIDGTVDVVAPLSRNGIFSGHPATLAFDGAWFERKPLLWRNPTHVGHVAFEPADLGVHAPSSAPPLAVTIAGAGTDKERLHAAGADHVDHVCMSKACPTAHILSAAALADGAHVLVTTSDVATRQTLAIWTPTTDAWRVLKASDGQLDGGATVADAPCAIAAARVVCVAAEPSGPPKLVAIDLVSARQTTLFDPNASLRARSWPTTSLVWPLPNGLQASGQLLLPRSAKPASGFPLVIDYYSCRGFQKGGLGDELPLAPLAQAGVATLCINAVRGSMTTERIQDDNALSAITTIVDRLAHDGTVDRDRIGMAGLSFGSSIVLSVAERTHLLRAAAIATGQIEPYYYWVYNLPGRDLRDQLKTYFGVGNPDTDKAGWNANSFVAHVDAIKAPLLIQIPENEMRITMEFYSRLAVSPTPVEMFGFANETHDKWEPRHKLAVYERNLDWFRFWLLGEEDADPAKAAQYARWRAFSSRPGFALPIQDHPAPELGVP